MNSCQATLQQHKKKLKTKICEFPKLHLECFGTQHQLCSYEYIIKILLVLRPNDSAPPGCRQLMPLHNFLSFLSLSNVFPFHLVLILQSIQITQLCRCIPLFLLPSMYPVNVEFQLYFCRFESRASFLLVSLNHPRCLQDPSIILAIRLQNHITVSLNPHLPGKQLSCIHSHRGGVLLHSSTLIKRKQITNLYKRDVE